MTNWYAVGVGFVVELLVGAIGVVLPGLGQLTAGLLGGFVAGYLAGGGFGRGAWHGLLAGALGGIVLAVVFGLAVGALGTVGLGPLGPLLGGSVFLVGAVLALAMGLESALAGAVGGWIANE
ncbi:DUF5518 domain-containing protein [Halorussus salilacus]|uniref:DUF5518 domain-containing protein n=1 Tax=Halorussus salilacus TaxID=2953750 RepID=UPI00209CDCD0|nr:DUF5518 domain-containing protein [Halorussus salilacus]USZ69305.1 DUF5518 domain-containing protein [Halorussus salilacus]